MSIHLAAHELSKHRRGAPLLGPVTLTAGPGAPLGITGPPGSGKTVLLQLLTGHLRPTAGTVTVNGQDLAKPDVRAALWERTVRVMAGEGLAEVEAALSGAAALVVLDEPWGSVPGRVLTMLAAAAPTRTVLVAARDLHGLPCQGVVELVSPPGVLRLNER